jgi:hypothetical protein
MRTKSLRMSIHFTVLLMLVCGGAVQSIQAADEPASLQLSFGPDHVTVTGVKPGADVYLFSVAREPKGYYNSIVYRESTLHDTAKLGRVDFPLGQALPARSIWFAVDLSSGTAVSGAPSGYGARAVPLDEHHLKQDFNGDVTSFYFEGAAVDVIVVRPGTGIWGATTVGLGSPTDDRLDKHGVSISVVKLEPRAGTTVAAPSKLKNGDVVFMMNSYKATYAFAVVGGAK